MVKKTQTQKAGDEPGYCIKNGLLKMPEKSIAVQVTAKIPESEKIKLVHDLKGKKPVNPKKPVQQTKISSPSVMLPKSDRKSYWNTPAGKKRIEEMKLIMKKNKGKLVKA